MNKHLEQIVELSKIDKEIDAFEPQIEAANRKYEAAIAVENNLNSEITILTEEVQTEQVKKQKNELHLQELSTKLEENAKKSADIKTEREMKSLQLEEEIAKEQVSFANDEIERLEKLIALKEEKVTELVAKLEENSASLGDIKKDVDAKLKTIDVERQEVFGRKEKLIAKMNQKGITFYQKIRRWAKNTAAVPVKKQACMGCYMVINDRTYADVIKGEEITICPHCGRFLYMEQEEAVEA